MHPRDRTPWVAPPPPSIPAVLDPLADATVAHADNDGAILAVRTAQGRTGTLRLRPATPNSLRITLRLDDVPKGPRVSVVNAPTDTDCTIERSPAGFTLHLDSLSLKVRLSPLVLELTVPHLRQATDVSDPSDRTTVLPLGVTELTDGRLVHHDSWTTAPDEHF